jgi:hypothetical protein
VFIEGRSWAEWKAGKPLSSNGLARLLKPLKVRPETVRIGDRTPKGYYVSQFEDAFRRYLDQEGGLQPQHRNNLDETGASEDFPTATSALRVADEKFEKPNSDGHCCGVADADRGAARAANGNGSADHRCDHCGQLGASGQWDWPGRPDGVWLHTRCEGPWFDAEGELPDEPLPSASPASG